MKLLYDVFINDRNVGRVWMNWPDDDPFVNVPGVRFHLVMDLDTAPGTVPAIFKLRG